MMAELSTAGAVQLLETGQLALEGLISWGSNYTFLVNVRQEERETRAIYKPRKGERPLWDFASGTLCLRERAAFLVSEAIGWHLVPPTVLRDGPHGWGSVQLFIEHDPDEHYFTLQGRFPKQLQQIVLFDVLVNNADRKGGHVLLGADDRLWSIDHGICFNAEYKLRSVIWDFAGMPIPAPHLDDLARLQQCLADEENPLSGQLSKLLADDEMVALQRRLSRLLREGVFPQPGPGRHYPWPPV